MVNDSMSIAVFCICGAIFAVLLKRYCREQSLLLAVGVCTAIMVLFMNAIDPAIAEVRELFGTAGIPSDYISLVFKAMAICFITQITCDLCRDSGESAIASAAEMWGRGTLTIIALPLLKALIEMINEFL